MLEYVLASGIKDGPLFRTAVRKTKKLSKNAMTGVDICRMMKRRLKAAGLPDQYSPHSFRGAKVTDLLEQKTAEGDAEHRRKNLDLRVSTWAIGHWFSPSSRWFLTAERRSGNRIAPVRVARLNPVPRNLPR